MKLLRNAIKISDTEEASGDELASDCYPTTIEEEVVYKMKLRSVTEKQNENFDIGSNPSAEEEAESLEASETKGLDAVLTHRLKPTPMPTAKHFKAYIKSYAVALKVSMAQKYDEATCKSRLGKLNKVFKFLIEKFDDLEFFTGEHFNDDGTLVIVYWDEVTPYAYIPIDGLTEEKL